ncbi:helicase-related protein [Deinococcus sp. VB343]|uniref:helicase-related protein n=1 Tax=Deinococcus sp. VB343 TaxID=3385567 RepID=UPI0039C9ADD2
MTQSQKKLPLDDLFGTYREIVKPAKKDKAKAKPKVTVEMALERDDELRAFAMHSAPQSAPAPKDRLMGVEALGSGEQAVRLKANALATQIAMMDGELTKQAEDALLAWSGEGGLGDQSASTNAFYTPAGLVELCWNIARGLGAGPRTLEFSAGGGAFLERAPKGSLITAVELDEVSSRVAQALYPHATHWNVPFETYHQQSEDAPFDLVIGNPPYGGRGVSGNLDRPSIRAAHWYFTVAGLERLLPGGYMVTVVPESMLRNPSEAHYREDVLDRAHLLGAFAVPDSAFRETGAGVTTVILVLRRHDAGVYEMLRELGEDERRKIREKNMDIAERAFVNGELIFRRNEGGEWQQSSYFSVLSPWKERTIREGRFGDPVLQGPLDVSDLDDIIKVVSGRRLDILTRPGTESAIYTLLGPDVAQAVRNAQARLHPIREGKVSPCKRYRFTRGAWGYNGGLNNPSLLSSLTVAQAAVKAKMRALRGDAKAKGTLQDAQDAHIKAFGGHDLTLIAQAVKTYPALDGIEAPKMVMRGGTLSEIAQQLEAYGLLDEYALAAYANVPPAAVSAHLLAEYAFDGQGWQAKATYYQGNAEAKARECEALMAGETGLRLGALKQQAQTLRSLAPWVDLCDMTLEPRDTLIPEHILTQWVNALLGTFVTLKRNQWDKGGIETNLLHVTRSTYGVQVRLRNALDYDLDLAARKQVTPAKVRDIEDYLNFSTPVKSVQNQDAKTEEQINAERSAYQLKAVAFERELAAHFRSWLLGSEYAGEVEEVLNHARYGLIPAQPDTRALSLDAYKGPLAHPFQAGHVRTAARMSGVILNFGVGLGKTLTALMLAALLKQSGRASLPAIVVPLSRLGDWVMNAANALPDFQVLVVGGEPVRDASGKFVLNEDGDPEVREDSGEKRRVKFASLLTQRPDLIIMTAEALEMIPMLEETHQRYIESNMSLMSAVGTADSFDDRHRKLGGHKELAKHEAAVSRHFRRVSVATETDVPFEALGIDTLIADEVHMYKNSHSVPRVYGESSPKFLGSGGESNRALDALHKFRYVREQGGVTVGLTATFFGNSPLEIFNMLALHTDVLESYGIPDVSTFVARFCVIEPRLITDADGSVEYVPCVIGFRNLDELRSILAQHVIRETEDSCQMHTGVGLNLPPLQTVEHVFDLPDEVMDIYAAEQAMVATADGEGENHLFAIYSRLLKLTLHPPLRGVDVPNTRFAECVRTCMDVRAQGGSNLIFMYMGGPDLMTYKALKAELVAAGYPEREIEIITAQTHPTGGDRLTVERRVRRGELTCVIGSKVIEEGGNYQGVTDMHHLDFPFHHQAFVQRIGRARRQGTWVKQVRNHVYFARGSFDAVRYQMMLGKKGWADQVYDASIKNCEYEGVGFSGEDIAVMFSRNPEATRREIQRKKEERAQQAREATLRIDIAPIREYLDNLRELRRRYALSRSREHGPSVQDVKGIERLTRAVRENLKAVGKLREAGHPMSAVTRLKIPLVWGGGLPLHVGMTFKQDGQEGKVLDVHEGRATVKVKLGGNTVVQDLSLMSDVTDVLPSKDDEAYGAEVLESLPRHLQEAVMVEEQGKVETVLPEVAPQPQTMSLSEPALPEPAPTFSVPERFGLSVAAQVPSEAAQVFAIVGDRLIPGAEGETLLALIPRANGEIRQVTVVLRDERKLAQARQLMTQGTKLRQRVLTLMQAA